VLSRTKSFAKRIDNEQCAPMQSHGHGEDWRASVRHDQPIEFVSIGRL
jgi:hypothetical protein